LAVDLLDLLFYIIIFLYCLALNNCNMIYFVVLCPVLCLQSSRHLFIVIFWQLSGQSLQGFNSQDDSIIKVAYASPDSSEGT